MGLSTREIIFEDSFQSDGAMQQFWHEFCLIQGRLIHQAYMPKSKFDTACLLTPVLYKQVVCRSIFQKQEKGTNQQVIFNQDKVEKLDKA